MTKYLLIFLSGLTLASAQSDPNAIKEVLAASEAWRQAIIFTGQQAERQPKDVATLEKYLHPDLTYVHSNGHIQTKAQVIADKEVIETYDFSDTTVRVYGTTALISAKVEQRGKAHTAHLTILHVWINGPTGWQLVARQAVALRPTTPNNP